MIVTVKLRVLNSDPMSFGATLTKISIHCDWPGASVSDGALGRTFINPSGSFAFTSYVTVELPSLVTWMSIVARVRSVKDADAIVQRNR